MKIAAFSLLNLMVKLKEGFISQQQMTTKDLLTGKSFTPFLAKISQLVYSPSEKTFPTTDTAVYRHKRNILSILTAVFLSAALFFPNSAALADSEETEVEWQELSKDLNYPSSEIEKVALECWNYNKLFPFITKSLRISRNQCYIESQIEWKGIKFDLLWMKIEIREIVRSADGKVVTFKAHRKDGNIKIFDAEGKLYKIDDTTTKTTLRIKADPGVPGIPVAIIEDSLRTIMRSFFKRLKLRLEKEGYNFSLYF
jgi:hypothetical protein